MTSAYYAQRITEHYTAQDRPPRDDLSRL